jgi:phosphoribosylformylglycinamidine synthase subunit PurL
VKEPVVNLDLAIEHGLSEEEYEKILGIMGRTPTYTELGIFSVMWSEHCSYKNSYLQLKTLPKKGKQLLVEAGEENAGLIDIGEDLAVAFKIESHNHPSAVEPYQGAATGVGGIMRDIFTMGARPIAALNSLRFGELDNNRNKYLFDGVVKGIGDYGNCLGIPTVSGEVYFEECYTDNCLVNAMTVGVAKKDRIAKAILKSVGASIYAIGSATGRDGIHGATFASEELTEESEEKRSSVQVGDPFTEKLLLEATLELIKEEIVEGIQDMGAAGLTSSSAEMSAKSELGIEFDLDKLHLREQEMIPYEIMLSESQERMLAICKPGKESEFENICKKWDLDFALIGKVTDTKKLTINFKGEKVCDIPSYYLSAGDGAPVYKRESKIPDFQNELNEFDSKNIEAKDSIEKEFLKIFSSTNIVSKQWVYHQYDYMVRTNTVIGPGSDAAVIRIKGTDKAISMKTDCNGRYVYLDPRTGAKIAVAEAARNVVCSGARPLAVTNCLNFGNPYKPDIYWQFSESIAGMGEACIALETPVTGGNVSFYNESDKWRVYPTPVIGMIGLIDDLKNVTPSAFQNEGDLVYLIGETKNELGGSEYLKMIHDKVAGMPPQIDMKIGKSTNDTILKSIKEGYIVSAHDVSDGGLSIALAECCIINKSKPIGIEAQISSELKEHQLLFSETQSRFIISVKPESKSDFESLCNSINITFQNIGKTGGNNLSINDNLKISLSELNKLYYNTIAEIMTSK